MTLLIIYVGRQCKNREGYLCWNVFSWVSCLSVGSNNELRELLLQLDVFHFKFFSSFQILKFGSSIISLQIAAAKDPDTSFFRKLDGFQPCELTELKAGTHVFAVYGKCIPLCSVMLLMFFFYCNYSLQELTITCCQISSRGQLFQKCKLYNRSSLCCTF